MRRSIQARFGWLLWLIAAGLWAAAYGLATAG